MNLGVAFYSFRHDRNTITTTTMTVKTFGTIARFVAHGRSTAGAEWRAKFFNVEFTPFQCGSETTSNGIAACRLSEVPSWRGIFRSAKRVVGRVGCIHHGDVAVTA